MKLGEEVKPLLDGEIKLWRRTVIIVGANCLGVLMAGGILGFFSIVWNSINDTDKKILEATFNTERIAQSTLSRHNILLDEIAHLRAEKNKKDEQFKKLALELNQQKDFFEKEIALIKKDIDPLFKWRNKDYGDNPYEIGKPTTVPVVSQVINADDGSTVNKSSVIEVIQQPSAVEVMEAKEMIQQRVDKADYRRDKFNPKR